MVRILTTGDDTLNLSVSNAGDDSIFGLDGSDVITSDTVGGSLIAGNRDNDSLTSSGQNDTVFGGQDNDVLRSLAGNSLFFGDFGDDYFESRGSQGGDIVYGLGDDDIFNFGNGGGENLAFGNTGTDFISGSGYGDDTLFGGTDNDTLQVIELGAGGTTSGTGGFVPFNTQFSNVGVSATQGVSGTGSVGVVTGQGLFGPPRNPGDNYLSGDKGNDLVTGIGDRDTLLGGEDNDTLMMLSALSNPGNQNTSVSGSTFTLSGVPRANFLDGGIGDDSLHSEGGDRGRHTLIGGDGKDTMTYIGVDSYLLGGAGDDSLRLAAGTTTLTYTIGRNTLYGGQGNDTIFTAVGAGTNWLYGDKGNDSLIGSSGDTLFGGTKDGDEDATADNDYLSITAGGRSWMDGGKGSDTIFGGGTATLVGGAGDDSLDVLTGNNASLLGGEGSDVLTARGSSSSLSGGAGNDTLTLTRFGLNNTGGGNSNTLLGGEGNDSLFALSAGGSNYLDGGTGNDILVAGSSSDTLIGGAGNDLFVGSSEADTLGGEIGRSGNDTLYGFKGADSLIGIRGSFDGFYYNGTDQGSDTITSFDTGTDKFYISESAFGLTTQGQQLRIGLDFFAVASGQTYPGSFTGGTAAPAIVFDAAESGGGGTLYWDPSGGTNTGTADLSVIAVIQSGQVSVNDIVIF